MATSHAGDIVDGQDTQEKTQADLDVVRAELDRLAAAGVPLRHVIGNHCVLLDRPSLYASLGITAPYYSVREPGWRFVVLDGVDVNVRWPDDTVNCIAARAWIAANPDKPNAVSWNGGLSDAQIAWFERELADADAAQERVAVFCHLPVLPAAADARHVLFDYERVLAVVHAARAGVVVAWFAGHYHPGGYAYDHASGTHHVTLQAVLEAPDDGSAYGFLDVYPDRLVLRGHGSLVSRTLPASGAAL